MEVSALKYHGGLGLQPRSPLLRLQSDERLVAFVRRGNVAAFETLVGRYEARLLAFCRHLLGSREDAEDILQEVLAAAFNAILADDRPIRVRPWLYRIARNRSLNHLRRNQAVGVDSMDIHFSDNGASTADKVHEREEFRLLVGDIQDLPETQRTALVLREMDALSYEQIAEAMETTVPSVKSLLVRARVSLAEAAEARLLSCDHVRLELGEVAEGLKRRPSPLVRRHLRSCERCSTFRLQLRETNKALAALLPFGPFIVLKKLVLTHAGHSAGSGAAGSGAAGSGAGTAGSTAAGGTAAGGTAMGGSALVASTGAGGSLMSAGIGAVATKAVAGIAAAALVTAGAVEVGSSGRHVEHHAVASVAPPLATNPHVVTHPANKPRPAVNRSQKPASKRTTTASSGSTNLTKADAKTGTDAKIAAAGKTHALSHAKTKTVPPLSGRTVTTTDTNLQSARCGTSPVATGASDPAANGGGSASCSTTTTTPTTTTTTPTTSTTTTPTDTGTDTSDPGTTTDPSSQDASSPQDGTPPSDPPQGTPTSPDGGSATTP